MLLCLFYCVASEKSNCWYKNFKPIEQLKREIPWCDPKNTIRVWRADASKSYCQSRVMPLDDTGWFGKIAQSERLCFIDVVQNGKFALALH